MIISELVREFSGRTKLPIDVNDIVGCFRHHGVDGEIEFLGVDLDPEIMQGQFKEVHVRDSVYGQEVRRLINIYYHRGHPIEWQRFICAKELIHVLDHPSARTSDPEAIDKLAAKIGLPPEMQDPMKDGHETNVDRLAEWRAIALLFPLAARNQLLAPYRDNVLKLGDIARLADIPSRYVGFAMHESWDRLHDILAA